MEPLNWFTIRHGCESKRLEMFLPVMGNSSYLTRHNKWIDTSSEDCQIAKLCLSYFSLPGFEIELPLLNVQSNVLQGYYSFFDYAIAYWCQHLQAAISSSKDSLSIDELSESIEIFLDQHWVEPKYQSPVPKNLTEKLSVLQARGYFEKLVIAVAIGRRQLSVYSSPKSDENVLDLYSLINRIRHELENPAAIANSDLAKIQEFYGQNLFKCPRMSCKFFYHGFSQKEHRDEHIAKHERAFFCSFPNCPMSTLGYASAKELSKHENEKHNIDFNDAEFPDPDLDKPEQVFPCPHCDRQFTRKFNLNQHLRTHSKNAIEERFTCKFCQKSFKRNGDKSRHETTQHSESKKFICGGMLSDGTNWGCGKAFNRGENLARHYKSKRGSKCVPPKSIEADEIPMESDDDMESALADDLSIDSSNHLEKGDSSYSGDIGKEEQSRRGTHSENWTMLIP